MADVPSSTLIWRLNAICQMQLQSVGRGSDRMSCDGRRAATRPPPAAPAGRGANPAPPPPECGGRSSNPRTACQGDVDAMMKALPAKAPARPQRAAEDPGARRHDRAGCTRRSRLPPGWWKRWGRRPARGPRRPPTTRRRSRPRTSNSTTRSSSTAPPGMFLDDPNDAAATAARRGGAAGIRARRQGAGRPPRGQRLVPRQSSGQPAGASR